jgi:hypothetical protein
MPTCGRSLPQCVVAVFVVVFVRIVGSGKLPLPDLVLLRSVSSAWRWPRLGGLPAPRACRVVGAGGALPVFASVSAPAVRSTGADVVAREMELPACPCGLRRCAAPAPRSAMRNAISIAFRLAVGLTDPLSMIAGAVCPSDTFPTGWPAGSAERRPGVGPIFRTDLREGERILAVLGKCFKPLKKTPDPRSGT